MDSFAFHFELGQRGHDITIHRSTGEKFDKITGLRVKCEAAVFDTCVLITQKRSREFNEIEGKRSEEYLQIISDEPLYSAQEQDAAAEDRIEYPARSGVFYRITEVDRKGDELCQARAIRTDNQEKCNVLEPTKTSVSADLVGFSRG